MGKIAEAHLEDLSALRARYLRELPGKCRSVGDAAAAVVSRWDHPALDALYHLSHRLAGSAAIYGFAGVSTAAAAVEGFVAAAIAGEAAAGPPEREAELRSLVSALDQAVASLAPPKPSLRRRRG